MKTFFARGVLALLWYLVWVGAFLAIFNLPSPNPECAPDAGIGSALLMAWVFSTSAGLTLYAIGRSIGWLFDSAFFSKP